MKKVLNSIVMFGMAFLFVIGIVSSETKSDRIGQTVESGYPGLTSGSLSYAVLDELPNGIILRTDGLEMTTGELEKILAQMPPYHQQIFKKNTFLIVEQKVTVALLLLRAKKELKQAGDKFEGKNDQEIIDMYINRIMSNVVVNESEVLKFYEENKDLCGGMKWEEVKDYLQKYILNEKKQDMVREHIRNLGQQVKIQVSAPWLKEQALLAMSTPLDNTRWNGKPSIVIFSAPGCCGPDKMLPVTETLRNKYSGQINIVYIDARQEQILTIRYNIYAIPIQILYDKNGKEIFRHKGFFSATDIDGKLIELGVVK